MSVLLLKQLYIFDLDVEKISVINQNGHQLVQSQVLKHSLPHPSLKVIVRKLVMQYQDIHVAVAICNILQQE